MGRLPKTVLVAIAIGICGIVGSSDAYAQSHDQIVEGFKQQMGGASCGGSILWLEYSGGGDNALFVGKKASLVFTPWIIQCNNSGTVNYKVGKFLLDSTDLVGETTFSATANTTGFTVTKGSNITFAPPSSGWPAGSHYLRYSYDFGLYGYWNGRTYGGVIYVEGYNNSVAGSVSPSPVGAGNTVTYNYTFSKTGTYASSSAISYYTTGKGACGSASSPCGTTYTSVGGTSIVSRTYTTTAADAGANGACQTLYFSPVSDADSGWGSKKACATVDSYTNDVTATATPTKLAAGGVITYKWAIAKNKPSGGSYATSPTVKYYISNLADATYDIASSESPNSVSVALGASQTVTSKYTTKATDVGDICQRFHWSPYTSAGVGWTSNKVCASVYTPWVIEAKTTVSSTTDKAGGVKVPTGSSFTFTHNVKNNGQKVEDDSGNPVKVNVAVYQYVRGGTKSAVPATADEISKFRTTLFEEKDKTSTAASWTLMSNKQFTLTVTKEMEGKTYCQYVISSKSKRGSSDTARSTPACVYIPCT
ncbi:MAG: hypothetical protein LBL84_00500 [Candidatus Nomurabacteria bacterium]|jgi:hypothetical protein|nr:hypothetical protein [Candidatus Nomurabacteria bacterium]